MNKKAIIVVIIIAAIAIPVGIYTTSPLFINTYLVCIDNFSSSATPHLPQKCHLQTQKQKCFNVVTVAKKLFLLQIKSDWLAHIIAP
jgi:hypothetical protein